MNNEELKATNCQLFIPTLRSVVHYRRVSLLFCWERKKNLADGDWRLAAAHGGFQPARNFRNFVDFFMTLGSCSGTRFKAAASQLAAASWKSDNGLDDEVSFGS